LDSTVNVVERDSVEDVGLELFDGLEALVVFPVVMILEENKQRTTSEIPVNAVLGTALGFVKFYPTGLGNGLEFEIIDTFNISFQNHQPKLLEGANTHDASLSPTENFRETQKETREDEPNAREEPMRVHHECRVTQNERLATAKRIFEPHEHFCMKLWHRGSIGLFTTSYGI